MGAGRRREGIAAMNRRLGSRRGAGPREIARLKARTRARLPAWMLAWMLAGAAVLSLALPAAAADGPRPNVEITLGLGGAGAFESDIFNVAYDNRSTPDALLDLRVRQNLNPSLALGFHLYGTGERTPDYVRTDTNGNIIGVVNYDLSVLHFGVDARYLLLTPPIQPYFEFGVSLVAGSVADPSSGNLQMTGASFGGGPGVQIVISRHLAVGAQGLFAAGSAKWDKKPFLNSTGRDYNPGFAGAEGFLTYRWWR